MTCPIGFYKLTATLDNKCMPCHSDCCECNGPNANDCTTCKDDKYIVGS